MNRTAAGAAAWWRAPLTIGAPFALAVVEVFHPHPGEWLSLDVSTWLVVHYAQVLLFPLCAWAIATLVQGDAGIAATICRVAMFVFAVTFVAFDTAAGVVTGVLADAARKASAPDGWLAAIDAVWRHPVIGGSPTGAPPLLALLGSIALSVGSVAAAVALRGRKASWGPALVLAVSSFGISVFKTHAWPGGPLTFGGIALAAVWLTWEHRADHRRLPTDAS
jgi:hypothetical protein